MKIYVASGGKTPGWVDTVVVSMMDALRAMGHTITFDWTKVEPFFLYEMETKIEAGQLAAKEVDAVSEADILVVLLPAGRGAHLEMGIALGAGKMVYLVSDNTQHHELTAEASVFYFHPHVLRFRTPSEVLEHLQA